VAVRVKPIGAPPRAEDEKTTEVFPNHSGELCGRLLLGRYLISERIAVGGMAEVYLATHGQLAGFQTGDDPGLARRMDRGLRDRARGWIDDGPARASTLGLV